MTGPAIIWREGQPPRSAQFGDLYYSAQDGLAEARQVFLRGCDLPNAWDGRRRFTIAELGFGTGLNLLAVIELWLRAAPPDARLDLFSLEAFPLDGADAARALAGWPELAPVAKALLARWPGRRRGFHRLEFPQWRVTLDLAVMEAADALRDWSGTADAWFLDGFSPALNPQMWRREVLELIAARSAPGARLATYTVAGEVRRGLTAAGFAVERAPGFGAKRQRLEGRWPGAAAAPAAARVTIIGGGIAGAALARAFRGLGMEAKVFDAAILAASTAPAALVTPRLDAGLGPPAALFANAFARARDLYRLQADVIIASGVLQLAAGDKDGRRFAAITGSDLFEPGELRLADAAETSRRLGEAAPPALAIDGGLVVRPANVLAAWLGSPPERAQVAGLVHENSVWRLVGLGGEVLAEAEIVCVACGMAAAALVPGLPLRPVRGQASFIAGAEVPVAALFGGYIAPAPGGVICGATHDRDDESLEPRDEDHRRNLAVLAAALPALAARLGSMPAEPYVGVRATTSDYLPMAGAGPDSPPGLFVLTGLGSRGYTLAPMLAEHVAGLALGAPSPLPRSQAALLDPARFAARARRRGAR